MSAAEFSLIDRYFLCCPPTAQRVPLGIGDDAAAVSPGSHPWRCSYATVKGDYATVDPVAAAQQLIATSCDALLHHGDTPRLFTLTATLPAVDHDWLQAFSAQLATLCKRRGLALIGGDTSRGDLSLQVFMFGTAAA